MIATEPPAPRFEPFTPTTGGRSAGYCVASLLPAVSRFLAPPEYGMAARAGEPGNEMKVFHHAA